MANDVIAQWHAIIDSADPEQLSSLLDDDAVFHSPIVHTPQRGKALTQMYLTGAFHVLVNGTFRYVREVVSGRNAVLEFTAEVDGITINGVDMITWNDDGKIIEFKVMVRPLKAIQMIHQKMTELLQARA